MATANAFVSLTYDGVIYSQEVPIAYSIPGDYTHRFIGYGFGMVENKFSFRIRWATRQRMAFSTALIRFG